MANRLEAVCMRSPGVWVDDLTGLPVIAVRNSAGDLLTTNLTESHRIASSHVLDGKREGDKDDLRARFARKIGLGKVSEDGDFWPMGRRADLESLVFAIDPAALLHGFQFVQWKFVGLRQTRLLHARLEAELADEPEVHYGMVKWDAIEPESTREERANKGQSIAAKSRLVPKNIAATFEIDMLGLKSLSLGDVSRKFLLGLALWKIGAFLANKPSFDPRSRSTGPSLRLRADCYMRCGSVSWSGNSASGDTSTDDLMAAKPAGLGPTTRDAAARDKSEPDFETLVKEQLAEVSEGGATAEKPKDAKSSAKKSATTKGETAPGDDKQKKLYGGPLVEVIYEPKPKKKEQGPSAKAAETDANAGQTDDQQG
jgi:hypothetical protein